MGFRTGTIVALIAICAVGCGGATGPAGSPPSNAPPIDLAQLPVSLPPDQVSRDAAGALGNVRLGSQFYGDECTYPFVYAVGDYAEFLPGMTDSWYVYARYLFRADRPWDSLRLEAIWHSPPVPTEPVNRWIGLMGFPEESILWFAQEATGEMFIADAEPYIWHWTDDEFYVLVYVVVTGEEAEVLEEVTLLDAPDDVYWELEHVNTSPASCTSISLSLDAADEPRLLFQLSSTGIYYAARSDGSWPVEPVFEADCVGYGSTMALDSAGHPHVAWKISPEDTEDDGIYYATKKDGMWSRQVVVVMPGLRLGNLVVDAEDRPRFVYYLYDDASLNYAFMSDEGWLFDRVKGPCNIYSSLFVTPEGVPHIAYQASKMLWYAYFKGPTWWTTNIDDQAGSGTSPSLVHDGRGDIHIAYTVYDQSPWPLMYSSWDGESALFTNISEEANITENVLYPIALVDSQDLPHIAFCESVMTPYGIFSLKHARYDGHEWLVETVYDGVADNRMCAFALDSADRPHFCFCSESTTHPLYYARPR